MRKIFIPSIFFTLFLQASMSYAVPTETLPYTPQKQIPETEIRQFVTAIDAIHRYYIKPVTDETLLTNAIRGMVNRLDPHSTFLDKQDMNELDATVSGEFVGIGVELTTDRGMLKVISAIEGTPAEKAGLKPGDLIVKVDKKLIQDLTIREAINFIKGKRGTEVTLTIIRKDEAKPLVIPVTRDIVKVQSVKSTTLLPGYGSVRIAFFQGPVEQEVRDVIQKLKNESGGQLKGLVLDLRNNPGGLLDVSADVADLFLDTNQTKKYDNLIVYTKGRLDSSNIAYYAKPDDIIPHVPLIVLINGGSASASEIVAGALQDYKRAIVMGTRSFGKGSVQTVIPIGPSSAIKLTTALYYTPAGREIQARGIEPNVTVPELQVGEKQVTSLLDLDEENYERHIENETNGSDAQHQADKKQRMADQKSELELAKKDYQMFEALMMLKGMHSVQK